MGYFNFLQNQIVDNVDSDEAKTVIAIFFVVALLGISVGALVSLLGGLWLPFISVILFLLSIAILITMFLVLVTFIQWVSKGY